MTEKSSIRVRFAPSPTGYLHVGGARTALFNWLFARQAGGTFVLRIEDTDRERSEAAMTQAILDSMEWLGLTWDEGPFHQVDGMTQHQTDARRILAKGRAYRCFCTVAELEERRAASPAGVWRYDRRCLLNVSREEAERRAAAGEPHTLRFHVPEGITAWDDAVYGRIEFNNQDIEDFIILRTDGTPIYNMAVVSDDVSMRITHVLRGDDHISNTPKQILLYNALDAQLPVFAHLPMILGPDGKRLSKRHGATAVGEYRVAGILPDAMVNFLALLGWSPGTDQEVFTREELIASFSISSINRKSAIFDVQKLNWLNGQHLAKMGSDTLLELMLPLWLERGVALPEALNRDTARMHKLIDLLKIRARTLQELADQAIPYLVREPAYDQAAVDKHWKDAEATKEKLRAVRQAFSEVRDWNEATLETALRTLAEQHQLAAGKFIHPLRVALTGQAASFGIFEVAAWLGRETTEARIDRAIAYLGT